MPIDWGKTRRENLVRRNGSEPSEFPDITKQIAKAKGFAKVRGPMLQACSGCGRYFDPNNSEPHVCPPRPKVKKVKCRKCGEEMDPSCLSSHLREAHPPPWWPTLHQRV
jgi:hypothetical protein